jgi:hypothetical protein
LAKRANDDVQKDDEAAKPNRQPGRLDDAHRGKPLFQWRTAGRWGDPGQRRGAAVVSGTINGGVSASESLELQAGSRVKGDVHYKSIEMQQGAVVEGRLMHEGAEVKAMELKLASGS